MIAEPDLHDRPQTILVVEDEVLIRLEVSDNLRDHGYHVIEASSAAEALVVLKTDSPVDLVFTDVQMPGPMDGLGLARWVRENRPGALVLLTSGLIRTNDLDEDLRDLGPVQEKPVSEILLLRRIRSLLGDPGT